MDGTHDRDDIRIVLDFRNSEIFSMQNSSTFDEFDLILILEIMQNSQLYILIPFDRCGEEFVPRPELVSVVIYIVLLQRKETQSKYRELVDQLTNLIIKEIIEEISCPSNTVIKVMTGSFHKQII